MAQSNYSISVNDAQAKNLSKNELQIVQQVGLGRTNKEIAKKLFLSEGTVRNYISKILSCLELRDRTQLAIWAVQKGIINKDFS
ncbi:Transcriptional regulatory protein LiaR [Lactobacillus helveticus]|uniref:Transcriptional regulatory protein LiaR n=2 Tax=Lactobacillus helveticus TaxID=1587 RepID=A0A3S8SEG6_LACHE|nr:Transcriptional regulatory protein LiaR [Lactobacillus helveticus]